VPDPDYLLGGYLLAIPTETAGWPDPPVPGPFVTLGMCLKQEAPEPGFEAWWFDRDEAEAVRRSQASDALLLAVGFAAADVPGHLADADPYERAASYVLLRQHHPMPSGKVVGFEIVTGGDGGVEHSWLCYGYPREAREELGIEVGDLGLLRSYDEARTTLQWMLAQVPEHQQPDDDWVIAVLVDVD
jgi:hypothetical protein